MRRLRHLTFICLILGHVPFIQAQVDNSDITVSFRLSDTKDQHASVTMSWPCANTDVQTVQARSRYGGLVGLDRYFANLSANADGSPVALSQTELDRWEIEAGACTTLEVSYTVFLNQRTEFDQGEHIPGLQEMPILKENYAFFLGYAVFLAPDPITEEPVEVNLEVPEGWSLATPWVPISEGTFVADDFEDLRSAYFAMGPLAVRQLEVAGMQLTISLGPGTSESDDELLLSSFEQVFSAAVELFGRIPRDRYLVIANRLDDAGIGGAVRPNSIVLTLPTNLSDSIAIRPQLVVAHEFSHTWECDLEVGDELEWFHEGFTEYLALQIGLEAGLLTEEMWWELLETALNEAQQLAQRAERPSLVDAGSGFMHNPVLRELSYQGGVAVAFLLDRSLSVQPGGGSTVQFLRQLRNEACPELEELTLDTLTDLLDGITGDSIVGEQLRRWVTAPFPEIETLVSDAGCQLEELSVEYPRLGVDWEISGRFARITTVHPDTPAHWGGLENGDLLDTINGEEIHSPNDMRRALSLNDGPANVQIRRRGETHDLQIDVSMRTVVETSIQCDSLD